MRGRGLGWLLAAVASCACAALLTCAAFVPRCRFPAAFGGQRSAGPTLRSATDPWKPLVFKMPRKKPPREIKDSDDEFTVSMRKRYENLQLQEEKAASEARPVSETKIDDLVLKEADDAKINARYALWRMDRENDRIRAETENPSLETMRRKFQERADHLDGKGVEEHKPEGPREGSSQRTFLEPARVQDIEELFESAALRSTLPTRAHEPASGAAAEEDQGEDWGQDYLEAFQARSRKENKLSSRVVKSPEDRRQDYEAEKLKMFSVTSGLGVVGTASSVFMYGQDVAFGFFLGSIGALLYLSGLTNYADNAESPLATAAGGRRFLVPVLLVLLVIQWYKLEILFPVIASLHLNPSLPACVFGFFTYIVGQVAAGLMTPMLVKEEGQPQAEA